MCQAIEKESLKVGLFNPWHLANRPFVDLSELTEVCGAGFSLQAEFLNTIDIWSQTILYCENCPCIVQCLAASWTATL